MIARLISLLAFTACVGLFVGCNTPAPSPAPAPEVHSPKLGMNVNYAPEIGAVVVETGVAEWPKTAADVSASTATAETSFGLIGPGPSAIPISTCQFHTAAAVVASNTAYATLNVFKRNSVYDGAAGTLIATVSTSLLPASDAGVTNASGSWTQFSNVPIPSVAGAYVSPGDSLTVSITKTGAGVVVPQGQLACFTTIQ